MKRNLSFAILFAVLMIASCKEEPSLSFIEGNNVLISYGDTVKFTLKYTPEDALLDKVTWRSSAYGIISRLPMTSSNATEQYFIARGIGEANISAEANIDGEPFATTCQIIVKEVEMTSIKIETDTCRLKIGDKTKLTAIYEPSNTSFPKLTWSSSDKEIATINDKGEVSAVGLGECVITVSDDRSGLKSQCHMIVLPIEMSSLVLNETQREIEIGDSIRLTASYEPKNTTLTDLYWHSSDEKVATVSNGTVKAIGVGECVISVTNSDNSLTATCDISVFLIEMSSIACAEKITIEQYEVYNLEAKVTPADATTNNNALRWHSSDETIATVDELTGKVYGVGVGECTITISNIYNSTTASCQLTVTHASVKSISLNKDFLYLPIGNSEKLSCTINPDYAYNKNVKWESSNNEVATVDENGTIKAISKGKATITVAATDGSDCFAECSAVISSEETIETYVINYIETKISINLTRTEMPGNFPILYCYFDITNNGDEKVYLREARCTFYQNDVYYDEGAYIEPGETLNIKITNKNKLNWFFELHGVEHKRPNW